MSGTWAVPNLILAHSPQAKGRVERMNGTGRARVDAMLLVDRREQRRCTAYRLRSPENQYPTRLQGIVKYREQSGMCAGLQVYEYVAAADNIKVRERRIRRDILHREDAAIPHRLTNAIAVLLLSEEPRQAFWRDIGLDANGIHTGTRHSDSGRAQIGCEHLDACARCTKLDYLQQTNRN